MGPVTAQDLAGALPGVATLRRRCRALAMLDAILSPDEEDRYYGYNSSWGPGTEIAEMRDGSGDEWHIVFGPGGVFVRGFDHESVMSPARNDEQLWPGLTDAVPAAFAAQLDEPAFGWGAQFYATVCVWRETGDDRWHTGEVDYPPGTDPDGADHLFAILLDETPASYRRFAEDCYEVVVDPDVINDVFALTPLTDALVKRLNPAVSVRQLGADIDAIGYPA
ncbi:hypothetical protein GCM10010172_79750 [Paractinoplanes ferrugineus]|uniref:Uncharacterized protein n=1 Tax=Paractinoplanes ferrugineus TaxID=113564 RepID=A0A919J3L8_9ACTN|nr:hypothetical protein [Actinoplanes ferrugineus]GIE13049.1 hypothetical protein Afe05nite_48890 [Actinoplanes ferrugineus]